MVIEEWKSLEFMNCSNYEVSNLGRVRNLKTGRFIKGFLNRKVRPYRQVSLTDDDKCPKAPRLCRLVAMLFVPNPENKEFVDHIDGDTLNDVATNLRWVTREENMNNPITIQRLKDSHIGQPGHTAWNKGKTGLQVAWNKGLTKEEDERVESISTALKAYWKEKRK